MFGEYLRREREIRGIDVGHIARQTKYTVNQLQRLESGDPSAFAAQVFLAGAVRGYAQSIGADPEQMHLHLLEVVQWRNDAEGGATVGGLGGGQWQETLLSLPWGKLLLAISVGGLIVWWVVR